MMFNQLDIKGGSVEFSVEEAVLLREALATYYSTLAGRVINSTDSVMRCLYTKKANAVSGLLTRLFSIGVQP